MSEPLRALETEAEAPEEGRGGRGFRLVTALGEALLEVPPVSKWRASARAALVDASRIDADLVWAKLTLAPDDFAEWMRCDPNGEEASEFLTRVFAGNGESLGKSGSSTGSSKGTRKR